MISRRFASPKSVKAVDVVDPQPAVFGIELIRYIPQQVFVAAQDLSGTPDRKHASDGGHGSSGSRLQSELFHSQVQLVQAALRQRGDAGKDVSERTLLPADAPTLVGT